MLKIINENNKEKILDWLQREDLAQFNGAFTDVSKPGEGIFNKEDKGNHIEVNMKDSFIYGVNAPLSEVIFDFFKNLSKEFPDIEISGTLDFEEKYASFCVDIVYKPGQAINMEYNTLCDICGKKLPKQDAYIAMEDHYAGICSFKCAFDYVFGSEDDCCDEIEELDVYDEEASERFWEDFCEYCDDILTPSNAELILDMIPEEYEDAIKCTENYIDDNCY